MGFVLLGLPRQETQLARRPVLTCQRCLGICIVYVVIPAQDVTWYVKVAAVMASLKPIIRVANYSDHKNLHKVIPSWTMWGMGIWEGMGHEKNFSMDSQKYTELPNHISKVEIS